MKSATHERTLAKDRCFFKGNSSFGLFERLSLRLSELVEQALEVLDREAGLAAGADLDPGAEALLGHRHLDALDRLDQVGELGLRLHQGPGNHDHEGAFNRRSAVPPRSRNLPSTGSGPVVTVDRDPWSRVGKGTPWLSGLGLPPRPRRDQLHRP